MKRVRKAILLLIRSMAYHLNRLRLYYWSDFKLYELRSVCVMPRLYYRWIYNACLWLVKFRKLRKLADRTIHTIPLNIRFEVA